MTRKKLQGKLEEIGLTEVEIRRMARHFYDDWSAEEIGKDEGVSPMSVRDSLRSALVKLANAGMPLPEKPKSRRGRKRMMTMEPDMLKNVVDTGDGLHVL